MGRQLALQRGANVVMPNLTPVQYRRLYEIYPNKICITEESTRCVPCISGILEQMGKKVSDGYGHTPKEWFRTQPEKGRE